MHKIENYKGNQHTEYSSLAALKPQVKNAHFSYYLFYAGPKCNLTHLFHIQIRVAPIFPQIIPICFFYYLF